jgi:hypothetical protein
MRGAASSCRCIGRSSRWHSQLRMLGGMFTVLLFIVLATCSGVAWIWSARETTPRTIPQAAGQMRMPHPRASPGRHQRAPAGDPAAAFDRSESARAAASPRCSKASSRDGVIEVNQRDAACPDLLSRALSNCSRSTRRGTTTRQECGRRCWSRKRICSTIAASCPGTSNTQHPQLLERRPQVCRP